MLGGHPLCYHLYTYPISFFPHVSTLTTSPPSQDFQELLGGGKVDPATVKAGMNY